MAEIDDNQIPINDISKQFPNNADGIGAEINTALISQANVPGFESIDPYTQELIAANNAQFAPAQIGAQGQAALFPGLKHNINVGGYSGSIIGAGNIYVPGGNILAVDPILARRKAIDDAARAKAASIKPFQFAPPPQLTDPGFQGKFNELYYNTANRMVSDAYKKYGKDAPIVLKDQNTPEGGKFIQAMANYEVLARNMNAITDEVAGIDEGLESGELEFSDETLKLYNDYKKMIGNFDNEEIFGKQDLRALRSRLYGNFGLENLMNDPGFIKNIMGEKTGYSFTSDKGEFYDTRTGNTVSWDKAIPEVAKSLAEYGPMKLAVARGDISVKEIEDRLRSRFKKQVEVTSGITKKDQDNISGTRVAEEGVRHGIDKPEKLNIFDYDDSGNILNTKTDVNSYYAHDINTAPVGHNKAIKITGATVLNKGEEQTLEGAQDVQLNSIETVKYKDKWGQEQVRVVAMVKVNSPVKRPYIKNETTGKWDLVSMEEYKKKKKDNPELTSLREEEQLIDKAMFLSEGTAKEISNKLDNDQQREAFRKAYKNALDVKSDVKKSTASSSANPAHPLPQGQPRTVTQGGYTYTWNESTGKYE